MRLYAVLWQHEMGRIKSFGLPLMAVAYQEYLTSLLFGIYSVIAVVVIVELFYICLFISMIVYGGDCK